MAEIGRFNTLRVVKHVDFGVYLDAEELGEILLPNRDVPAHCHTGDMIEVFIFRDSEDRLIATTQKPYAMVDQVAFLKVVSVTAVGAFLDWGLPKDLLVPFREQQPRMEEGRSYLVFVYLDEQSQRIAASSKLEKFLENQPIDVEEGQQVDLVIGDQTEIGYKVIINNSHWGVLYNNEVFQVLHTGQRIQGFIKKVRNDGKIDCCLQKPGYKKVDDVAWKILETLHKRGGFLAVTDKSSPECIYALFGVSKKTFKKAIGALYKKRCIIIEKDGIKFNG
jgi:predicted RNA-binding protein (virulence factor B family)